MSTRRAQLWGWFALGSIAAVQPAVVAAQSAPARVYLRWARPPGSTCMPQPDLQQRVEALVGQRVFVPEDRAELVIAGDVQPEGTGWVATLQVTDRATGAAGVRRLRQPATDCAAFSSALTVVLATLISLDRPQPQQPAPLAIALGAAGVFDLNVLPSPSFGGSVWLGITPARRWALWLDASLWQPIYKLDALGRGGTLQRWQGGLSLCRELAAAARVAFAACAGGWLGAIDGRGEGLGPNRRSLMLLAQTGLEGAFSWQLLPVVGLRASATGTLALRRPRFYLELPGGGRSPLYRPPPLGFMLRLGLTVALR